MGKCTQEKECNRKGIPGTTFQQGIVSKLRIKEAICIHTCTRFNRLLPRLFEELWKGTVLNFPLGGRVEAIETSGPMGSLHLFASRFFQYPGGKNSFAKVPFIEPSAENDFIDVLQVTQGELLWQQVECDCRVIELPT